MRYWANCTSTRDGAPISGQRLLTGSVEEETNPIEQNDQQQNSKVESAGNNAADRHALSAIFLRVILNLHERHNAQYQRDGRRQNSKVTAQPKCDTRDSQNE